MTETNAKSSTAKKLSAMKAVRSIVQGAINIGLMIWTVRDIRQRSDDELNGKRNVWLLAAFAPPVGPIAYFLFGRKRDTQPTEIAPEPIE
jgi:hypothetical protein